MYSKYVQNRWFNRPFSTMIAGMFGRGARVESNVPIAHISTGHFAPSLRTCWERRSVSTETRLASAGDRSFSIIEFRNAGERNASVKHSRKKAILHISAFFSSHLAAELLLQDWTQRHRQGLRHEGGGEDVGRVRASGSAAKAFEPSKKKKKRQRKGGGNNSST